MAARRFWTRLSFVVMVSFGVTGLFCFAPLGRAKEPSLNKTENVLKVQSGSGVRPSFLKRKLFVGEKKIEVEIADSDERRAHGLMFVESLPKEQGMLFVFDEEETRSFWMKNTLIPLSIAYINKDMVITEILDMQPAPLGAARPKSYPSRKKSMYALEMNIGWFEKNKIWPGARIQFADNSREKLRH